MASHERPKPPQRLSIGAAAILLALAIYLLPLAVIFMDEVVFHTFYFSRTFGPPGENAFRSVYPFLPLK